MAFIQCVSLIQVMSNLVGSENLLFYMIGTSFTDTWNECEKLIYSSL